MSVRVTKSVNITRKIQERLRPTKKALKTELERHKKELTAKVKSGKGFDDKPLGRYKSKSYKARRRKRGLQTSKVDLSFTGKLLKSIKTRVRSSSNSVIGTISVTDTKKSKAQAMQERFSWFGISKQDLSTIVRNLKQTLRRN